MLKDNSHIHKHKPEETKVGVELFICKSKNFVKSKIGEEL